MRRPAIRSAPLVLSLGLAAVLLLAFALRLARLDAQSVWYDEGMSYHFAHMGLRSLWHQATQDNHPPLYFILLHFWMKAAGEGEFALRSLSVAFSLLSVPAAFALGRRLAGPRAALLGCLLLAAAPFHVWYAQEARMYALLTLLALLSSYALLRALEGGWRWWSLYALFGAVALYTHFYATLFLLAQAVFVTASVAASALRAHRYQTGAEGRPASLMRTARPLRFLVAADVGLALLFLPWLRALAGRIAEDQTFWRGTLGLWQMVKATGRAFVVGDSYKGNVALASIAVYGTLLLFSLALSLRSLWREGRPAEAMAGPRDRAGGGGDEPQAAAAVSRISRPPVRSLFRLRSLYLPISLLLPVLILYVISHNRPKFAPRYLLFATPALYLLVGSVLASLLPSARSLRWGRLPAAGLPTLRSVMAVGAIGVMLSGSAGALGQYYGDPTVARDDFRAAAAYVQGRQTANDVIFFVGGHGAAAFDYYYQGGLPEVQLPGGLILSVEHVVDAASLRRADEALVGRNVVWLVMWQEWIADPAHLIFDRLSATAQRLEVTRNFQGLSVAAFQVVAGTRLSSDADGRSRVVANFGDEIELVSYEVSPPEVRPGDTLHLVLYWRARKPLQDDYTAFVHLTSPATNDKLGQWDKRPLSDSYPTSRWIPRQTLRDEYAIPVRADARPETAALVVGLYRSDLPGMPRLPVLGPNGEWADDKVFLGKVPVVGP